jgi:hypothetical protein
MIARMTLDLRALLLEVAQARCSKYIDAIDRIDQLSPEERLALQQAVADELVSTGLGKNDEPNERGVRLEALIDAIGRA